VLRRAMAVAPAASGGEWGVGEIVAHLRASDAILSARVFQVLVREGVMMAGFDERAWGELYAAASVPLAEQLDHFALRRGELVAVLRSLSAEQWLRSGEHEQLGTQTVADICGKIVEHEGEHRAQVGRIVNI
jgi:DinB superfamily